MANASAEPFSLLAPNTDPQKDEIPFSGDRNFAVHGEIMLLVLVLLFACFLLCIVYFLCKRRSNYNSYNYYDSSPKLGQSEPTTPVNSSIAMFKFQFKDGLNLMPESNSKQVAEGGCRTSQLPV